MKKKKKTRKVNKRVSKERKKLAREVEREEITDSSTLKVISVLISIAFAVFIALSNFSLCGTIGNIVRSVMLSTLGTLGYLFPLVIIFAVLISLFNTRKVANVKIYALLILYLMIICFIESMIHDFSIELDIASAIDSAIVRANDMISIDPSKYSAGILGTSISFILNKAIDKTGSLIVFATISIIAILILFGFGISKVLLKILKAIIMFIPNMIIKANAKKEEDRQIAIDNENILKETIEKSKKVNLEVKVDEKSLYDSRLVLEPIPEKHAFDTSRLNISADDVKSRLYQVNREEIEEKNELLREMKKKSINEIMYEKKEIKPDAFFYTEGMRPIDQMENIVIPEPKIEKKYVSEPQVINNSFYKDNENRNMETGTSVEIEPKVVDDTENDSDSIYNDDNKSFASGLSDQRDKSDTLDYKNMSSSNVIQNTKKDIELRNSAIRNEDLVSINLKKKKIRKYKFPPISFLNRSEKKAIAKDPLLNEKSEILVETLKQFGVGVTVTNITVGPSVTRFELKPDLGVKVAKILALENDVKLALSASDIRIEAPIPGKPAIGIEIPNKESSGVNFGDIVASNEFRNSESKLTVAIGKDISGKIITTDLRKMPHLLIAGATGSGKSVCINSIIMSLIYKSSPEDVRLIMVDPKVVELQIYDGIPHLLIPVVTAPKKAASALNWAVNEMTRRYNLIQERRVRDIESYNQVIEGEINKIKVNADNEAEPEYEAKLPYIVIIIDEFADLMMTAAKEVENSIMRIAQLARACGIYLVIATQRPSVNVISGSIKTNVPSRISFAVASGVDSQTILDRRGAEKLLGHGDMLYFPQGIPEPIRVQGCYVSESEILKTVDYVKDTEAQYDTEAEMAIEKTASGGTTSSYDSNEKDELYFEAGKLVIEQQNASIGMLQRRYRIGFNRAARIIDELEAEGVVSRQDGKKPREVLMTMEEFLGKEK